MTKIYLLEATDSTKLKDAVASLCGGIPGGWETWMRGCT